VSNNGRRTGLGMRPYSPAFCFQKGKAMNVRYRRNREIAFYDSESLKSISKPEPRESLRGPFKSCGECPYPSHGFICYSAEGDCLKTQQEKFQKIREEEK